jgi:hypothetical protein
MGLYTFLNNLSQKFLIDTLLEDSQIVGNSQGDFPSTGNHTW